MPIGDLRSRTVEDFFKLLTCLFAFHIILSNTTNFFWIPKIDTHEKEKLCLAVIVVATQSNYMIELSGL